MRERPTDAIERDHLCDLFLELGPDAPTLCEGWTALDLAAHLVVREHDPRAGFAILGGERFSGLERRLLDGAEKRGFDALVARLRGGPPLVPWRLPGLRTPMNLNEWFVHHEDVRRANGMEPRTGVTDLETALWHQLRTGGWLMARGLKGAGLELEAPGFGARIVRNRQPVAQLRGSPQELMLYLNGRRSAARVELRGDQPALDALAAARFGI
jgi:uncharacterized protein (TIGR03085 family)